MSLTALLDSFVPSGGTELPAGAPPDLLGIWEMRGLATSDATGPSGVRIDGGARVEWDDDERGEPRRWRFMVGAPAEALAGLADSVRLPDPSPWQRIGAALAAELRARVVREAPSLEELRALATAGGVGVRASELEVAARLRVLVRSGQPALHEAVVGLRARVTFETAAGPWSVRLAWDPATSPPWRDENFERWMTSTGRVHDNPTQRAAEFSRWCGLTVLLPSAAAWAAHEFGHAAIEQITRADGSGAAEAALVDEPTNAPWPAGFTVDDRGEVPRAAELWNATGPHPLPSRGHQRRSSVRDAARPAMSATYIRSCAQPVADVSIPAGTPIIARVYAGRYDPQTDAVALEGGPLLVRRAEGDHLVASHCIAIIPSSAWAGVRAVGDVAAGVCEQAICTRHGQVNAVMVGAPTIALEPVLVTLSNNSIGVGKRRHARG